MRTRRRQTLRWVMACLCLTTQAVVSAQDPGPGRPPGPPGPRPLPLLPSDNAPPRITSFLAEPSSGIAPLTVQFSVAAADRDGSIESVTWDFGDGTAEQTTTHLATEHLYKKTGTFTAKITVTDNRGAAARASVTISVPAVRSPAQQLSDLIANVTKLGLTDETKMLQAALKELNSANYRGACRSLSNFGGQIQQITGRHIMPSEAAAVVSAAGDIREGLRCAQMRF